MYSRHRVFRAMTGLASACLMILVSRQLCGAELSSYFAEAPEGNLVRRLRDTTSVLPPGLTLQRQLHRMPSLGVLLIENTLVNRQDQPVRVGDVTIADWTFTGHPAGDPRRYTPLTYRDEAWYGSTYWTGPDWNRIGKDWHHSGTNTSSVRRFVIPRDGQISVRGRIYKADTNGGDGVRLEIRVGGQTKWTAEIEGDDRVGVEPQLSLPVRSGDLLRFVVHRRGTIGFDTTHWDPVVTYDDGQVFQASQAFAAHRQGEGGWYYELESDAGTTPTSGAPAVHGFRRDLSLLTHTIQPDQDILLDSTDSISAWILADSYDASGVVLGVLTSDPWSIRCGQTSGGDLTMHFATARGNAPLALQPGQSIRLPNIWLAAYQGAWFKGSTLLQQIVAANSELPGISGLRHSLQIAARAVGIVDSQSIPELDLITLVQTDWQRQDQAEENIASYSRLTSRQLELTDALLEDLQREHAVPCFATAADKLRRLSSLAKRVNLSLDDWRRLYLQTRWLKRQVALANPLMDFGSLLICKRVPTSYSHLVMQYYGWRARPGGGIFVVSRPGHSLSCHDILDGQLSDGNVLEPRLSFDAKRIVFSFVTCRADEAGWDPAEIDNSVDEGFYHVWTVNVDGTDLRQVSAGAYDDLMPCWLPDGGIAFSSTRRRGYARCFGGQFSPRWHVYTLHRMNQDGSDIQLLSAHDTNEWFPTVSNTGHLIYSRWDYIDRDAVTHQNLWATRPDGTNPIAIWGNATSSPHCAFQPQPIPGSSKIVFTASAHHSIAGGSIAVVDPGVNNNGQEAIMRLTPDVPFPEAESRDIVEYYAAPWPLSEKYFLVAYSPTPLVWEPGANSRNALGIYLLDAWGNRELIYRDPDIGSTNPCPLVPRPMPPVVSSLLTTGAPPTGEMLLTDVYQGLGDVPRGTIKQLRIIQIFPKTTPVADAPRVGLCAKKMRGPSSAACQSKRMVRRGSTCRR